MLWLILHVVLMFIAAGGFISGCNSEDEGDIMVPDIPGAPANLPQVKLYSPESPFNKRIPADAPIDPSSKLYVNAIVEEAQSTGGLTVMLKQFSSTVFFAEVNTPRQDVKLTCGPAWELGVQWLKGVPIPGFARPTIDVDGAYNPIEPGKCSEEADQDNHMVVVDLNSRCEYDFWQMRKEEGQWVASWGNAISLDGTGVFEKGLSARGSGFAFLGGLIWPHELQQGRIEHALVVILAPHLVRAGGPVPPATESDGTSNLPVALPEGARLRLDPALNLESLNLPPAERTIARAMQEYGMIVADVGGLGVAIQAIDPRSVQGNPYAGLLPDEDFPLLKNIPLDKLQVLKLPPQDANFQDKLGIPHDDCAHFE